MNGKTLDYFFLISIFREKKKESYIICTQYANTGLNTKLRFPRLYSLSVVDFAVFARQYFPGYYFRDFNKYKTGKKGISRFKRSQLHLLLLKSLNVEKLDKLEQAMREIFAS